MADDQKGGASQDGGVGGRPAPSKRPAWAQFTDADRLSLRDGFGVTERQVFWLERSLTSIADHVRRRPRAADVGDELKGLARELAAARDKPARRLAAIAVARKRLTGWQGSARLAVWRSERAEALGHLGMAYAIVPGPQLDLVGDEPPTVELLGIIANRLSVAGHDRSHEVPTTDALLAFAADIAARAFDDRPPRQRRPAIASTDVDADRKLTHLER